MKKSFFPDHYGWLLLILFTVGACHNIPVGTSAGDSTARVQRGAYLVNTIGNCMHCHATRDFKKFSAPVIPGTEGRGGEEIVPGVFVRNITPFALGDWTDEELYRVLTTGIRKNGDTLTVLMTFKNLAKLPKEEIYSIIAYLRTLKPIPYTVPERKMTAEQQVFYSTLYKTLYLKHADEKMPLPSSDDPVKLGAYLVNIGNCQGCHSHLDRKAMEYHADSYLSGGNLFKDSIMNFKVYSANLTPDSATGIGLWTEEAFVNKFANFRNEKAYSYDPGIYNSPMPWAVLSHVNDTDLKAIYAYLRSIKPINNKVEKYPK